MKWTRNLEFTSVGSNGRSRRRPIYYIEKLHQKTSAELLVTVRCGVL